MAPSTEQVLAATGAMRARGAHSRLHAAVDEKGLLVAIKVLNRGALKKKVRR